MRKMLKSTAAVAIVFAMGFSLAGCSIGDILSFGRFDATGFLKGQLDAVYHGEYNADFMKTCDTTEKELAEVYNGGINVQADGFIEVFEIENSTQDVKARFRNLCRQMYDKADYTVVSAAKQSDGSYSVKVTIRPMDLLEKLVEAIPQFQEDYLKQFENDGADDMTDEEFEKWYKETAGPAYTAGVIDLLGSLIDNIAYKEEKEIVVQLEKDSDGVYSLNEDDLVKLDALMMSYDEE